jgi:hypothetical protein
MKYASRTVVISLMALAGAFQLAQFDHAVISSVSKVLSSVLFNR